METAPGKVIRSLRQALVMTQAEFARAAGWSASTISSWERGTARPSRLAFKTILAFAEERGVRYRPKGEGAMAEPFRAPNGGSTLPVLRLSSRLPSPSPMTAFRGGREETFGSRRWTEIAANEPVASFAARAASLAERPEWQVEARLHVKIGTGSERLRRTGYVAASVAALVIGLGAGLLLRTGGGANSAPSVAAARDLGSGRTLAHARAPVPPVAGGAPEAAAPVAVDDLALATLAAPALPGPPIAAETHGAAPDAPPNSVGAVPATSLARLESIVALDGIRRAGFHVGDRSISLVEGDEIGGRAIAAIGNDEVTLVGGGAQRRVRLGSETPLE
jgi:transcriptional regulator with XRE-family HTH domain